MRILSREYSIRKRVSPRSCGPCICIWPSCTSASRRYRAISGATGMRSELTTIRSHRRLSLLGCLEIAEPPSRLLSLSRQRRGLEVVSRRGRNNASRINSSPLKRLVRLPRSSSKFVIPIARGGMTKFVSRSHPLPLAKFPEEEEEEKIDFFSAAARSERLVLESGSVNSRQRTRGVLIYNEARLIRTEPGELIKISSGAKFLSPASPSS